MGTQAEYRQPLRGPELSCKHSSSLTLPFTHQETEAQEGKGACSNHRTEKARTEAPGTQTMALTPLLSSFTTLTLSRH